MDKNTKEKLKVNGEFQDLDGNIIEYLHDNENNILHLDYKIKNEPINKTKEKFFTT